MIESILSDLGLHREEIKTFLFLLENGAQTAGNVAKKTGMSRPSIYGFLRKLRDLGLVVESQKNGIKLFSVSAKEHIESVFDYRITQFQKGKAAIEHAYVDIQKSGHGVTPKFQLFEGKNGVRQVLKDMLLYKDITTKAYWPIRSMVDMLSSSFFNDLNKERIKQKIYTRAIWPQSQIVDIHKHPYLGAGEKFFREIRIAPKDISFSMGYWIYGDKAAFISSQKESFGFIIESRELVEMLSSQFEVIWNISRPLVVKGFDANSFLQDL